MPNWQDKGKQNEPTIHEVCCLQEERDALLAENAKLKKRVDALRAGLATALEYATFGTRTVIEDTLAADSKETTC